MRTATTTNAPYLFAALMLQAQEFGTAAPPTKDLISFYTKFAALRSPVQTWSEAFLSARVCLSETDYSSTRIYE